MSAEPSRADYINLDLEMRVNLGDLAGQLRYWAATAHSGRYDAYDILIDFIHALDLEMADEEFTRRLIQLAQELQKELNLSPDGCGLPRVPSNEEGTD